jgi:multidrug transporter EmrE-like cation transporter
MNPTGSVSSHFTRPVFLWAVAAGFTEVLVTWLLKHKQGPQWLGLVPLLPYMVFFAAMVRSVLNMDEMQKRINLESASIAFLLALILTFVFTSLEQAGVRAPWDMAGGFMLLLWTGAYGFSAWRYR